MTLYFASDHAAVTLKSTLLVNLSRYAPLDLGPYDAASVDYPDYATKLADAIVESDRGILLCGSGIGMSIAVNRFPHIRAALCHDVTSARLARLHNDANVLVLGARLLGETVALECAETFLETPFEGGRHSRRVEKLALLKGISLP